MTRRAVIAALLIGFSVQAEDRFGARGQVVPFGSVTFAHFGGNGNDGNAIGIAPGALWFAQDRVALGGSVGYFHSWGGAFSSGHVTTYEPQVGVVIPMGDRAALFPRIG